MELENNNENDSQYLTFVLADEEYGLDILSVQELRGWESPTPIPNAPSYVRGVINLRGIIVPIVDLRDRFALPETAYSDTTVVIIVKVSGEHQRVMGLVVDAVSEVYNINAANLQDPPDMDGAISIDFITGLATMDDKMIILLDINRLINEGVLAQKQQNQTNATDDQPPLQAEA